MKPPKPLRIVALTGLLLAAGCTAAGPVAEDVETHPTWSYTPDLPITRAPYRDVQANWKQRLEVPYVYVEHVGSYTETGRRIPTVHEALRAQGLVAAGPPFGLYYDDPGRVPVERLVSRACVPVAGPIQVEPPLAFDVLPSVTVAYALVAGPYPDVPRAYPGLFDYLRKMRWVEAGPVREIYLVPPGSVASYDELLTEVQVPATYRED